LAKKRRGGTRRKGPGARHSAGTHPPSSIGIELTRGAALPAMHDRNRRKEWGLPENPRDRGPYMVELNVKYPGGLAAAAVAFSEQLLPAVVGKGKADCEPVTTAYFRCQLSVSEWRRLIEVDEQWEAGTLESPKRPVEKWSRCIYRIWPDFLIHALTDRSVMTVKADAASRSYEANGREIVWAVIDSGVQADHPHFGSAGDSSKHLLRHPDVADLHRDFTQAEASKVPVPKTNVASALADPCGHGTHVAGVISGKAPANAIAFERVYTPTSDDSHTVTLQKRWCDPVELRGVAPKCKIVSLRVLQADGSGRSSDVIQALAYIREQVNTNPKLMRIHGVNLSVGYEFDAEMFACGQSPLCSEVNRLVKSGVVVVAAAGNTGYGNAASIVRTTRVGISNSINDPGNAEGAITVGATHRDSPHTYGVSYFSSKGPTGDGRMKPDLVAPGERITSCAAGRKLEALPISVTKLAVAKSAVAKPASAEKKAAAKPDVPADASVAAYVDDSGTSMAAPHVSGAIAAFLSIRREFIGRPEDLKRVFLESATPLGRERYFEGRGLLDLMRAIQSV
jgi:subtilisin family serine protease